MFTVQQMLDKGFGLVSINDLLSLTMHNDVLTLNIAELPGTVVQPYKVEIESRSVAGISHEVHDYVTQLMCWYHAALCEDIANM